MKKEKNDNDIIRKSVEKMITDKNAVRSYLKGKASIQALNDKGIKFANPLL